MELETKNIDPKILEALGGAPLIDSHVNLHAEQFQDDLDRVVDRALAASVKGMLTISDKITSTDAIRTISRAHDFMWRSVGAHPHYAVDHAELTAEFMIDLAKEDDVVGIGECGLDFHYSYSPREDQIAVFRKHIVVAQKTGLPLIIHTREADEDMEAMLVAAMKEKEFIPLLHCYTSGRRLADLVMDMGGFISFSGIITFKNAEDVRAIATAMPLERIIIETDCPYLAPAPRRGKRCEPSHLPYVAKKLAELRDLSLKDTATVTTENFFRLFRRADHTQLVV